MVDGNIWKGDATSENTKDAYLTIRFEGPDVKPGRMRLNDFIQAATDFSVCAEKVALVLQNIPSTTKGRRPKDVTEALSLDMVAFTEGSPAVVAHMERTQPQTNIEFKDLGESTYESTYKLLLNGIEAVGGTTDALPQGFDLGVLLKIRDLGKLFNKGISRMEFQLNHRPQPIKAVYDAMKYERVRQRIAKPEAQQRTLQGRLLMADFKETGRAIRIHPSVGAPVTCRFPDGLSSEVEDCIRSYVKVTGKMIYNETGEPKCLELSDIESIETPVEAMGAQESGQAWSYNFLESPSAGEYALRQGVQPMMNIATLYGPGESEDWEGFDETLERWRSENPVK